MSGSLTRLKPVLLVAAAAAAVLVLPPTAASAATPVPGYAGEAYGSTVTLGSTVASGKSSLIVFGCGTPSGFHKTNSAAGLTLGTTLTAGTATTTGDTSTAPDKTVTTATTQGVRLLNGLVTADAVTAVSTVQGAPGAYTTSSDGTNLAALRVLGLPVSATPAPNTRINLPGYGVVILNEQVRVVTGTDATLLVRAVHVVVTVANPLGLAVGTNIIVAHTRSTLSAPQAGALSGIAYGSLTRVSTVVTSGPTFPAYLACNGTNGATVTNTGAGVNVPSVLSTGTITDTAKGTVNATTAAGETTSTIQNAGLLGTLVQATGIKAVATATRSNGTTALDSAGSTFASITVNGKPLVVADIGPNTTITVPGVGVLYLRRTIVTPNQIEVRMIELVVTATGVAGVPAGTGVQVGVARVSAR